MKKMSPNPPQAGSSFNLNPFNWNMIAKKRSWAIQLIDSIGCLLARSGSILALVVLSGIFCGRAAEDPDKKAEQLATDVWKASGGEQWQNVDDVRFSFVVEQDGKELFKADHVWNVPANTDDVKWKDKNGNEKHVKVNLGAPGTDEDSKTEI